MLKIKEKNLKRLARHSRIRKKVTGTTERPRLCVKRSLTNLYAQVIDDTTGTVLFGMSTKSKAVQAKTKTGGNVAAATTFGEVFSAEAQKKGIKMVSFDRGGYLYHGRVKAFAEAARQGGMEF